MKTLTETDILRIMREEWNTKVQNLSEAIDVNLTSKVAKDGEKIILSPELKILHKKSGIRYTIDSVGPQDCILRNPEGETFIVDADELQNEYELD